MVTGVPPAAIGLAFEPDCEKSPCRSSCVGTVTVTSPLGRNSRIASDDTKKNIFPFVAGTRGTRSGPPRFTPYVDTRFGVWEIPDRLLKKLFAFRSLLRTYSYAFPWKSLQVVLDQSRRILRILRNKSRTPRKEL